MTIELELSPRSCYIAKQKLNAFSKSIDKRLDRVCKKLAEVGAREAQLHARMAQGGNDDVSVSVEKMWNGYKVVMSGADIYFVEFGTGIFAGEYKGDASNVTVGIMPADYSDTHAKQFSEKGYWFYDNVFYRGTPAEMPMYWAGKRMREEMPRIVQEVFKT